MRFSRAPGNRTNDLPGSSREKNVPIKFQIGSEKTVIDTQDVLDTVRMRSIGNDGEMMHNQTELSFRKSLNTQRDIKLEDGMIGKDNLEPTTRAQLNTMSVDISVYGEKQQEGRKFVSKNARKPKQSIPHTATSYVDVEITPQRQLPTAHHKDKLTPGSRVDSLDVHLDIKAQQPVASTRAVDHTMNHVESHPEVHSFSNGQVVESSRQKQPESQGIVGFDLNVVQPFSREGRLKLTRQVSEFYSQTGRHMTHEELTTLLTSRPELKQVRRQVETRDKFEGDRVEVNTVSRPEPKQIRRQVEAPNKSTSDHLEVNKVDRQRQLKSQKKDKVIKSRETKDHPDVIVIPRDGESLGVDSSRKKVKQVVKSQRDNPEISHQSVGKSSKVDKVRGKGPSHQTNNMTPPELSSDPTIRAQAMKEKQRQVAKSNKGPDVTREDVAIKAKPESRKVVKEKVKVKSVNHQEMPEVKFALFDPLQKALEEKLSRAGPKKLDQIVATEITAPQVEEASKSNDLRGKTIPVAGQIVNEEQTEQPEKDANEVSKSTRKSDIKRNIPKPHREEIGTEVESEIKVPQASREEIDKPKIKQVFF